MNKKNKQVLTFSATGVRYDEFKKCEACSRGLPIDVDVCGECEKWRGIND